jgi:uncharacterized protein YndB with AHSA1/START domain
MSLHLQQTLNATPAAVFQQLTDTARLAAWFAEHADVSLPERRYEFWGRYTPEHPQRAAGRHPLLAAEPGSRLAYGWHVQDLDTVVEIGLHPRGAETVLVVQQTGSGPEGPADLSSLDDFWFLSLENLRRAVAGHDQAVVRLDFSADMRGDIRHSVTIDAEPEAVFKALIEPEQLNRWIASQAVVAPRVGGQYDFGWGMGADHILDLAPNERLVTIDEASPDGPPPTIKTWTLEGSGGRTTLTLVHSGFAPDQDNSGLYRGWLNYMSWIKSSIEFGPSWRPALKPLTPELMSFYPAAMAAHQADLWPTA